MLYLLHEADVVYELIHHNKESIHADILPDMMVDNAKRDVPIISSIVSAVVLMITIFRNVGRAKNETKLVMAEWKGGRYNGSDIDAREL